MVRVGFELLLAAHRAIITFSLSAFFHTAFPNGNAAFLPHLLILKSSLSEYDCLDLRSFGI